MQMNGKKFLANDVAVTKLQLAELIDENIALTARIADAEKKLAEAIMATNKAKLPTV